MEAKVPPVRALAVRIVTESVLFIGLGVPLLCIYTNTGTKPSPNRVFI